MPGLARALASQEAEQAAAAAAAAESAGEKEKGIRRETEGHSNKTLNMAFNPATPFNTPSFGDNQLTPPGPFLT